MNQTGFIKIIKKFYKSYPDRKGQFDQMTVENICQGGITVNDTANKMENFFADLFCQGILTEARAKMLPKKGMFKCCTLVHPSFIILVAVCVFLHRYCLYTSSTDACIVIS